MSIFITRDDQQLLATLCNSSTLQDFAAQHKALHSLSKRCLQTVLPGSGTHGFDSSSEEAEIVIPRAIEPLMSAASAATVRGFQLLSQAVAASADVLSTPGAAAWLCSLNSLVHMLLVVSSIPFPESHEKRLIASVAGPAVLSSLLAAFKALADGLVTWDITAGSSSSSSSSRITTTGISTSDEGQVRLLVANLFSYWRGGAVRLAGSPWQQPLEATVLPVSRLVRVALQMWCDAAVAEAAASASSSSSSQARPAPGVQQFSSPDQLLQHFQEVVASALDAMEVVVHAVTKKAAETLFRDHDAAVKQHDGRDVMVPQLQLEQLAASDDLQWVLSLGLAEAAWHRHVLQTGLSPAVASSSGSSSSSKLKVPPLHKKLYESLGTAALLKLPRLERASDELLDVHIALAACSTCDPSKVPVSTSSSSSSVQISERGVEQHVTASLLLRRMAVQLQASCLRPEINVLNTALQMMSAMRSDVWRRIRDSSTASDEAAAKAEAAVRAEAALAAGITPYALQLLLPAYLHAMRLEIPLRVDASVKTTAAAMGALMAGLLTHGAGPTLLHEALQQHPQQQQQQQECAIKLQALDAALRGWSGLLAASPPIIPDWHPLTDQTEQQQLALTLTVALGAVSPTLVYWGVACTCLKVGAGVVAAALRAGEEVENPCQVAHALLQAGAIAELAMTLGTASKGGSSSREGAGLVPAEARHLLAARSIYSVGCILATTAWQSELVDMLQSAPESELIHGALHAQASLVLRSTQAAIAWLGQEMQSAAPGGGSASLQQLQQQQASLCAALQDILHQSYSAWEGARAAHSSSSRQGLLAYAAAGAAGDAGADVRWGATVVAGCRTAVKPDLAQQLQEFGAAVCGVLPSKLCCNAPGCCCCCERLSEAELVGGKKNQCSGCKKARYCSRACQEQHWREHKPACKALRQR